MMGHMPQNFAELIIEEENGRIANKQMTVFFYKIDMALSEIIGNCEGFMWEEIDMEEVAKIHIDELQSDYEQYVEGRISIDINKNL